MNIRAYTKQDEPVIKHISRNCGSKTVWEGYNFLRVPLYRSPGKCRCFIFDNVGFYFCTLSRNHIRLIEFAVLSQFQGKGFGKIMLEHLKELARTNGIFKITMRTCQFEPAINFWEKQGARVVGVKHDDYELELMII